MEQIDWKIYFCWVKAHDRIQGNEFAGSLAKEAATNRDITPCYNKVSKSVVKSELEVISVEKCQSEWDQTAKGKLTKDYLPKVSERLNMKINLTQNFTTMVMGHGNIKAYLLTYLLTYLLHGAESLLRS
jgi:hypothetical protein